MHINQVTTSQNCLYISMPNLYWTGLERNGIDWIGLFINVLFIVDQLTPTPCYPSFFFNIAFAVINLSPF